MVKCLAHITSNFGRLEIHLPNNPCSFYARRKCAEREVARNFYTSPSLVPVPVKYYMGTLHHFHLTCISSLFNKRVRELFIIVKFHDGIFRKSSFSHRWRLQPRSPLASITLNKVFRSQFNTLSAMVFALARKWELNWDLHIFMQSSSNNSLQAKSFSIEKLYRNN